MLQYSYPFDDVSHSCVVIMKLHILGETGWGYMDWIDMAQDRDQWRALENTVTNLQVP
jgi:hypothetical protein